MCNINVWMTLFNTMISGYDVVVIKYCEWQFCDLLRQPYTSHRIGHTPKHEIMKLEKLLTKFINRSFNFSITLE